MRYQPFAEDIRALLFAGTRELHDRVDRLAARYDLDCPTGRAGLLLFMYRGLQPVEDGLERAGAASLYPDWCDRRRLAVLRVDIEGAGVDIPNPREPVRFASSEEVWGGLYVLEGSRLGARLIARNWRSADLPGFLRSDPGDIWPNFLDRLRRYDPGQYGHPAILNGARIAFAAFLD